MNNDSNSNQKIRLFAKLPKAARFKKSVLIGVVLLGAMLFFIILTYLSNNEAKTSLEDTLENEGDNSHWLAASSVNKPVNNDPVTNNTNEIKKSEDQDLTIKPSEEEQIARALKELNSKSNASNGTVRGESEEVTGIQTASNSPIQITNEMFNKNPEIRENESPIVVNVLSDTLSAGNFIPIIFLTEVNSDLGGFALAQVTREVSNPQRKVIIPQGSKILLQYESVNSDNERLGYKAVSITLPNSRSISLDNTPTLDSVGKMGLQDKSNHHHIRNLFSTLANISSSQASQIVASQIPGVNSENNMNMLLPMSSGNYFSQKGTTFYVRAGYECNLLLTHDLNIPIN